MAKKVTKKVNTKDMFKEIIIMLLFCIAIIMLFSIIFYKYIPMAKTVPNEVSYITPAEAKKELSAAEGVDDERIIMTYDVDSTDLSNYKRTQKYKPGKANPFSTYDVKEEEQQPNTPEGAKVPGNTEQSSGGHYFKPTQGK